MTTANRQGRTGRKRRGKYGWLKLLLIIIFLAGATGAWILLGPNTGNLSKGRFLYIPSDADYATVKKLLDEGGFIGNMATFDLLAGIADYPDHVKAGKYEIKAGSSNYEIIRKLRSGRQTPVRLVIKKLRTEQDLIRLLDSNLEPDSNDFRQVINNAALVQHLGGVPGCGICFTLPDTYEFWWNTSAEKTVKRLLAYYNEFWTDEKKQKAATLGLSLKDVITMASIIEEETNHNPEKPTIASVYLNRLKKGMRLQSDPTARYAYGDFTIKRITSAITSIPSPYNTYYTAGLPPGPICTPSKKSIDAVLNAASTSYLYFCAKEDFSGSHRFATTYQEHMKNAALYQQALNARGIH